MAEVPVTINGVMYPKTKSGRDKPVACTLVGSAWVTGLGVGGGPAAPVPPDPPIDVPPPIDTPPDGTGDPPGSIAKPPPPEGGWGWSPEYGWGYFPGSGGAGPKGA